MVKLKDKFGLALPFIKLSNFDRTTQIFIYLFIYLSTYLSIYLSIYLTIYLSIYLSIYLTIQKHTIIAKTGKFEFRGNSFISEAEILSYLFL